jgi:hypothetical protein
MILETSTYIGLTVVQKQLPRPSLGHPKQEFAPDPPTFQTSHHTNDLGWNHHYSSLSRRCSAFCGEVEFGRAVGPSLFPRIEA